MDDYTEDLIGPSPNTPPEGWEGESYWPRECGGHYHVTSLGDDLIGGKCDTYEEAAKKCRRLNDGEDTEDVLGNLWENMMEEMPGGQDD